MSETLDFPPILAPAAEDKPQSLKAVVTAQFGAMRPQMTALAAKYANVAFEITTPKGLEAAKKARHDLRENGRFMLQRTEEGLKGEVKDLLKFASEQFQALIDIIKPAEDKLHAIIVAEETRLEQEKQRKAKAEEERKARLQAAVDAILQYAQRAATAESSRIDAAMKALRLMAFSPEQWQEYAAAAAAARDQVVLQLQELHAAAVERENRPEPDADTQMAAEITAMAPSAPPPAPAPAPSVTGVRTGGTLRAATVTAPAAPAPAPAAPAPAPASAPEVVKLGELEQILGFRLTQAFIEGTLKVPARSDSVRAVLFNKSQVRDIRDALVKHLGSIEC